MTQTSQARKHIVHHTHDRMFQFIHRRWLIYNTCWEDPRIDRELMRIDRKSNIVMLTSAGCNALDYLLDHPAEIHTVDVNPKQNALLHLKLAMIRRGNYKDLFSMFGKGSHEKFKEIYRKIRFQLPSYARRFWDDKREYFNPQKGKSSFYFYGTSGLFAWLIRSYILKLHHQMKEDIFDLLDANDKEEQASIYARIEPHLLGGMIRFLVKQPTMMALLGVPRPQIDLIRSQYPDEISGYLREKLKHVFTRVMIKDNYFWRVYLTGEYTRTCCPNYLKEENFEQLRENSHRIHIHNATVSDFLEKNPATYTHYVLLDHQDWLAYNNEPALDEEWQLIMKNSVPGSKILMRSASNTIDFIPKAITHRLKFFPDLTTQLHLKDRVGTYGSTHLVEVL